VKTATDSWEHSEAFKVGLGVRERRGEYGHVPADAVAETWRWPWRRSSATSARPVLTSGKQEKLDLKPLEQQRGEEKRARVRSTRARCHGGHGGARSVYRCVPTRWGGSVMNAHDSSIIGAEGL
jgi:hypothetical protein